MVPSPFFVMVFSGLVVVVLSVFIASHGYLF